ncbi:MAG TPA: YrdB family protein [Caldilineaceae bacterium]|nr:YrdB family protein [Caldilineaceae bacterium]
MASHPVNLALRFLLELVALFAFAYWGWTQHSGLPRVLWAVGLPLLVAVAWALFRAAEPGGLAPVVAIPGVARLLLEIVVFGGATWAFYAAGRPVWAGLLGAVVLLHYLASYDRLAQLIQRPS